MSDITDVLQRANTSRNLLKVIDHRQIRFVIQQLLVVLYTGLMILQGVISLNCTNVIALLMSPNTILLTELSMYGTIFQTLLSRLLARYPFVVSWLNLI